MALITTIRINYLLLATCYLLLQLIEAKIKPLLHLDHFVMLPIAAIYTRRQINLYRMLYRMVTLTRDDPS